MEIIAEFALDPHANNGNNHQDDKNSKSASVIGECKHYSTSHSHRSYVVSPKLFTKGGIDEVRFALEIAGPYQPRLFFIQAEPVPSRLASISAGAHSLDERGTIYLSPTLSATSVPSVANFC
jgi:hypothetical protein